MVSDFKRVNKPEARKLFNKGETLYLVPCKLDGVRMFYYPVDKESYAEAFNNMNVFDRLVAQFEFHNCFAEVGYYAHYYVKVGDSDEKR